MAGFGGFGGCFDLAATGYRDPILVAATDGVGTKLAIAQAANDHRTIGIDLVAMCVNDLVVQGAEPLFFLDYFATARLSVGHAGDVVAGIAAGCREAGCALIGGETAEMPGLYRGDDYDLAGFAVGVAERDHLLTGERVTKGDIVLGLASSGIHSNGFSLVRRLIETLGLDYAGQAPFAHDERSLAASLLSPTRLYVRSCLDAVRSGGIKALAHITGGGLVDNPPRVIPDGLVARIDLAAWPLPPVFTWLRDAGELTREELARTFNCGIGMLAIVDPASEAVVKNRFEAEGETVYRIGEIAAGEDPAAHAAVRLQGDWAPWRA